MKSPLLQGLLLPFALLAAVVHAGPEEVIRARLKQAIPEAEVTSVTLTDVAGLYQVNSKNYESVLVSEDGRYLVQGELLEIRGNKIVSVTNQQLAGERRQALAAVKPADMVIFPAEGKTRAAVYVFTDVDCGYCRKLHSEMPAINKLGIEVRYLAFPRGGPHSPASAKMDSVWCARDPRLAMTQSKGGAQLARAPASCKSPVDDEFALGVRLGVRGTPAIMTADGRELGGYLPATELAKALDLR